MFVQFELGPGVAAVLDHAHMSSVLSDLKGSGRRRDKVADVFKVRPANARGAVHQEYHVGDGAHGAFWEKKARSEKD